MASCMHKGAWLHKDDTPMVDAFMICPYSELHIATHAIIQLYNIHIAIELAVYVYTLPHSNKICLLVLMQS